jgi:hypothetical protein
MGPHELEEPGRLSITIKIIVIRSMDFAVWTLKNYLSATGKYIRYFP